MHTHKGDSYMTEEQAAERALVAIGAIGEGSTAGRPFNNTLFIAALETLGYHMVNLRTAAGAVTGLEAVEPFLTELDLRYLKAICNRLKTHFGRLKGIYYCGICRKTPVDASAGYDTCPTCVAII
jgi:hypothetical protein